MSTPRFRLALAAATILLAPPSLLAQPNRKRPPPVDDAAEDDLKFTANEKPFDGTLLDLWHAETKRCCSSRAAPLVVDTHIHVWDQDPRPNRGKNQLGLLEDVITEGWGVGVDLGVLVQPGFRDANNTYITRSLELMPGALSGEVEYVIDYDAATLKRYHKVGVRGLRFKATSPQKYNKLVKPRLESSEFARIAAFVKDNNWHWGVQLAKDVAFRWKELLKTLQDTQAPIIVDMFGRVDPMLPAGEDIGTKAILEAAARPSPAGKIWMELGAPFRVDPRCTYAEPEAADPKRCLPEDRVPVARGSTGTTRDLCCPRQTHDLLVQLAKTFTQAVGEEHVVWGTDWPFITDLGVTTMGLLDAVTEWVPDKEQRFRVLGENAVRPGKVGGAPLYPLYSHGAREAASTATTDLFHAALMMFGWGGLIPVVFLILFFVCASLPLAMASVTRKLCSVRKGVIGKGEADDLLQDRLRK